jgi:hypothetical protein
MTTKRGDGEKVLDRLRRALPAVRSAVGVLPAVRSAAGVLPAVRSAVGVLPAVRSAAGVLLRRPSPPGGGLSLRYSFRSLQADEHEVRFTAHEARFEEGKLETESMEGRLDRGTYLEGLRQLQGEVLERATALLGPLAGPLLGPLAGPLAGLFGERDEGQKE